MMERALDVVVGLGSNLCHPRLQLETAVAGLRKLGELLCLSALYKTVPVGGPPQPDFLNAAARLRFVGGPVCFLKALQAIEQAQGRQRLERWGPRPLDLDILWVAGLQVTRPELEIPHCRLRARAFALRPLLDVAPEARDPRDGEPYANVANALGLDGVMELERPWILR